MVRVLDRWAGTHPDGAMVAIVVQSPDTAIAKIAVTGLLHHALRTVELLAGWQIATVEVRDLRTTPVAMP